jgi:hypothetical protein
MSFTPADYAKTFLEVLKLAPRYLIALGVMAAVLLFADEKFLKFIGVFDFAQNNRPMLGLTLIVTSSLFVVSVWTDGISIAKRWWKNRNIYRRVTDRLNCLTEDEKQILRYYINKKTRANFLRIDDGIVQGLVAQGIIYQSSTVGTMLGGFAHNISDIAWDYLNVHPHLLDCTTDTCRTDRSRSHW